MSFYGPDYEKELKEAHRGVLESMREFDRRQKQLLKQFYVPLWIKQGEVFVREDKQGAWKRLVKRGGTVRNVYGAAIQSALSVMRTIDSEGYDVALDTFKYLDGQWSEVLAIIAEFSPHGHKFVQELVKREPRWETEGPRQIRKYLDGEDKASELNPEKLKELNAYLKEISNLSLDYAAKSKLQETKDDLQILEERRKEKKSVNR